MGPLDTLLEIQAHDTAVDQIRHRRAAIPERAELEEQQRNAAGLDARIAALAARRDDVTKEERRFADEAASLEAKAKDEERKLYSGEIASPRELQALQADVDQLRRHQQGVEDRELDVMEQRERIESELTEAERARHTIQEELERIGSIIADREADCDAELARELEARGPLLGQIPEQVLAAYERTRASGAVGAARLVGDTCQGCHLSLPATEVTRIRRQPAGSISFCENCGCILVPS